MAGLRIETLARQSLLAYAMYQWPSYTVGHHHYLIAEKLEAVAAGDIQRLMIFMPPRHGKSMLASEFFPAWYLGQHSDRYIIHATYAQELAEDFGRKVRNQVADPAFARVFGAVGARQDSTSARRFHTAQGGAYFAVGAGGPITGRGAHLLLIDDPIKGREEADSDTMRRKLKDWFASVAYTRLMPGGAIVLIQTRWHEDDLAGWQLAEHADEGWEVLSLPAIDDAGLALWPEAYPLARLEQIRRSVGEREWQALYQQQPVPAEGGLIRMAWFQRYDAPPTGFEMIVQSWDTAQKTGEANDPSVGITFGVLGGRYWVLDVWRGRVDYPNLRAEVQRQADKWKPHVILIEDKASGVSLAQELRRDSVPVVAVPPKAGKAERMLRATPLIEAGKVLLPKAAPWLADFEAELMAFPNGRHDDQADALSQGLNWLFDRANGRQKPDRLRTPIIGDRYAGL